MFCQYIIYLKRVNRNLETWTVPLSQVIRGVHSLLSRLMSFFPTEPLTSNVASKYEELECLYACVSKVVYEGLTNYDKYVHFYNNFYISQVYVKSFVLPFP